MADDTYDNAPDVPFDRFALAVLGSWSGPIRGLFSEGYTITLLEDLGVPIARGFEGSTCDAGLLLGGPELKISIEPGKRLDLVYDTVKKNKPVVPVVFHSVTTSFTKGLTGYQVVPRPNQLRYAQIMIIEYLGCPSVRVLVPKRLFSYLLSNSSSLSTWVTNFASPIPSGLASCIVRVKDLAAALQNIRECAQDDTKPYRNPTTNVKFPPKMFEAADAQKVLFYQGKPDVQQMEDIYEAVKQAQSAGEAISMDIHLLPYISGDFLFRMDGRNYSVEAKINLYRVSNGQLSHMITSPAPNMPGFNRRMFHFSQSTQYLFTQLDQEAYFIPLCELPEDWYTSTLGSGHVSLENVQAYRIDLSDPSWVSELVRIIKDTRDIIAKGPKKPRPVLQRNFKVSEGTAENDANLSLLRRVTDPEVFQSGLTTCHADEVYRRLLGLCAQDGFGMILPFEQFPRHLLDGKAITGFRRDHHSYIMYGYRWTRAEVESYKHDRKLPSSASLAQLSPYHVVMPITMINRRPREGTGWAGYHEQRLSLRKFSAITQDYPQMIIFTDQIDDINTKLCVIPSEHVKPSKESFQRIVEFQKQRDDRRIGQNKIIGSGGTIYLDHTFEESFMHYMCPLADIPALLSKFLRRDKGRIFKEGIPPVDTVSYLYRYTDLLQSQLDNLLQVADQFKVKVNKGDEGEVVVPDEDEYDDSGSESD